MASNEHDAIHEALEETTDVVDLPPSGTSLHKRRRGEPPATLTVKSQNASSDVEGSSPCTAGLTPEDVWSADEELPSDPIGLCEVMLQGLKDKTDPLYQQGRESVVAAKNAVEAVEYLEKLLSLLDQFVTFKQKNDRILRRLRDVEYLSRMLEARKKLRAENERLEIETRELQMFNDMLDGEKEVEFGQRVFDSFMSGRRMKRTGSKWKTHSKFGGSLLRKQRSRSAGGDDSDAPTTPLRRKSEALIAKDIEKSKISKWTRVKAAFRWEKAQWPPTVMIPGAAGAVAAGALVGAVALAGSAPSPSTSPGTLNGPDYREPSLTPRSISLTPNSSCEELGTNSGFRKSSILRCDENDNTFLHAPMQDDSSTSPSPNKLHKSPWVKMKDIIQTRKESVRKKNRGSKSSPDVIPSRRRSMSDGADSDAPPVLTLTIPSSEELESEPSHPILRKQRSLELSARPLLQRPPRASKWSKVKRAFLTSASASVPSSPSRHSAFFSEADTEGLSSGCEASAVREEIARDYAALQSRLTREFSDRRGKLHAATLKPVATEEQLSADFRKKLAEWQRMKGVRQPPPVPARQDLSDDFLKKWDEWKKMKETNSVPAYEQEAKRDEVLVQTSTGLFKFKGISRSFTRKLHEWEKSRGIAPEASTSALLQAAKGRTTKLPPTPLTRTQSDGSVAPSVSGSGRLHASSLSVNDVDNIDLEFERRHSMEHDDDYDDDNTRGAVLVEVEAEEVCTAAPLVAMTPRHTPQKPVYTYGNAEARLLCETTSAITGTAVLQPNGNGPRSIKSKDKSGGKLKAKNSEKNNTKRKIGRQPSIEEDAKFIRQTIEEIERSSSSRLRENEIKRMNDLQADFERSVPIDMNAIAFTRNSQENFDIIEEHVDNLKEINKDEKQRDIDKTNGNKKKAKSRARLEREQSKPSETDTEPDVDTVTVEIPRRRKRLRRPSERPKTPPASLHSDSEGDVFILKLKTPEPREGSPEVIVKTTRKIFSPVVRSGETVPTAVIPLDVDELSEVKDGRSEHRTNACKKTSEGTLGNKKQELSMRSKSSGDLQEGDDQKRRNRPPLPLSPSSQRKPQPKETSPSIRFMIQRYNLKIHEDVHTSGASSGTSSPAWRSPALERRRPPDMPVGVNIRNNPFLEREVQKSASACQLSRKDQVAVEKPSTPKDPSNNEGVIKSRSAHVLNCDKGKSRNHFEKANKEILIDTASTDTIVPDLTKNLPVFPHDDQLASKIPFMRQTSDIIVPTSPKRVGVMNYERSISVFDGAVSSTDSEATKISERTAKIRKAKERFLSSQVSMRREGTSSAVDLRPGDRLSRISCESDATAVQPRSNEEVPLGRSASTGMVNVDREAWSRIAETPREPRETRSRFSLMRLAAKLRKKEGGAVSKLCRQSLLVQLRNKQ